MEVVDTNQTYVEKKTEDVEQARAKRTDAHSGRVCLSGTASKYENNLW